MSGPRLGLALGSGAARGWAHIGILSALAGHGLVPQVIAGASIGALVGAAFAAGRLGDLEGWVTTLMQRDVWRLVDTTFRGGGVMTGTRLMEAIAAHIGDAPIETLPVAYGAVATDLYTGEEIWLREGPFMTAVRASSGLPGLFAPTWHKGRWLLDGGVVNPLPVSLCRALGADIVIAVDLSRSVTTAALRARARANNAHTAAVAASTADMGVATRSDSGAGEGTGEGNATREASKEGRAILRRWSALVDGLVESYRSRRAEPGLLEVMNAAVNIMQNRITRSRLAIDPADLVLHPDLTDFQLMDYHRAREAIDIGRAHIEQSAGELEPIAARLAGGG